MTLKGFSESAKRMSSGNEFHSTGPAQEKDPRPYRSRLWRGTHNRALPVDLRVQRGRRQTMKGSKHEYNYLVVDVYVTSRVANVVVEALPLCFADHVS